MRLLVALGIRFSPAATSLGVFTVMAAWAVSPLGSAWAMVLTSALLVFQLVAIFIYWKQCALIDGLWRIVWLIVALLASLFALWFIVDLAGDPVKPMV